MENQSVIYCGSDIIAVSDILSVSLVSANDHSLKVFEEQINGPQITHRIKEQNPIEKSVLEALGVVLNKYWEEVSYYLPRPHNSFLPSVISYFEVYGASGDRYKDILYKQLQEINKTPSETYDVIVLWKYSYNYEGRSRRAEKRLSLRNDIYPTLNTIINLEPDAGISLIELGFSLLGLSSLCESNKPKISDNAKADLQDIYQALHKYFSAVDEEDKKQQEQKTRHCKYEEFMGSYHNKKLLTIKTQTGSYQYLESLCEFDVFAKKQEIENRLSEYKEKKRQEKEAQKKADAEARELHYQVYLADIKFKKADYIVEIKTDFHETGLLCQPALSNSEKLDEFSALQKFCKKYIPSLGERGFRIESLHKKYPDHISEENCNAFRDNWIRISRTYSILSRGANGEEKVNDVLRLYDDRIRILRSYTLEKNEHDFIVISPYGISTIEVKNLYGDYVLTETGMLKCLSSNKVTPKDVAFQSKRHLETLRRKLNACSAFSLNVPLQEIICSAEPNFTIKNDYHYIPVCYYNTVDKVLLPENGKVVLNKKAMDALEKYLLENQREAFKYDVFLPHGEINSRTDFIDSFAEVASGYMVAQNTANK